MKSTNNLTDGNILNSLTKFALPVLLALLLQALYGGVDLFVVGQFSTTSDVSGVATGSMVMQTITMAITSLSIGITVLVGQRIGERQPKKAGEAIGSGICFFFIVAVILTILVVLGSGVISRFMQAPAEAFTATNLYIKICGAGSVFIVAYNVLGSIFRGLGDSKTPLITVAIACVLNIIGDLFFVAILNMGAAGAALATVISQAVSVVISIMIIRKQNLPFSFSRKHLNFNKQIIWTEFRLGAPVALQDLLVGMSFLIIQMVVNNIGVAASAGVGVAERLCIFIMLAPSAYMQAMAAFTAQNLGAGEPKRASKGLLYAIVTSVSIGIVMSYFAFFHGDSLSAIFTNDTTVITESHNYLKAYAIDCMLTPFLFCFIGYYNGYGKTLFVMIQGLVGAFCIRVPLVILISQIPGVTLFHIGLATPTSTIVQILLCLFMLKRVRKSYI